MLKYLQAMVLCVTAGLVAALGAPGRPATAPAAMELHAAAWPDEPPLGARPATAPASWELAFRYQDPQPVSVMVPGQARPVVYWYMLYEVENPSEREVDFYPEFQLVTDTLKVITSETEVTPEAFRAIQRRCEDRLLVTPERATGLLLRGHDRARHSVAIWRDFDPTAKKFTVYVAGLSGEMTRQKNPGFDPSKPESETNVRFFLLRKTLGVQYKCPASDAQRLRVLPQRVMDGQKWMMR